MFAPDRIRITTNATTTLIGVTRFVAQIVIAVASAGTTWKFRLQDRASPAFVLIPEVNLTANTTPSETIINFAQPIRMENGIDIVTGGTPATGTPGELAVWVSYGEAS